MPTKNKKMAAKKTPAKKTVAKKPVAKKVAKTAPVKAPVRKAPVVEAAKHTAVASKPAPVVAKAPVAAAKAPPAAVARPEVAPVQVSAPSRPVVPAAPVPAARKIVFKAGEQVVYPAHGVGRIVQIEEQEIAGAKLELYIVDFEKEKLRLRVPTNKAETRGMRKLADKPLIDQAMKILRGRARIKRTMWSRRAQEYEAKINSGDLIAVAEVVRDLYRSDKQPEQSYSERQLFEQALERMAREIAAVKKIDDDMAVKELETYLEKNAHKNVKAATDEDVQAEEAA